MARLSLSALMVALATMVNAQEVAPSALPAVTAPSGASCGGCYVVADVAGIVFGGVYTSTQTNVISVGRNGSVTSTSIIENNNQLTFTASGEVPGAATSFNPLGSTITVAGATLTSPTMYEVFTAYSVISSVSGPNGCSLSTASPQMLASAYKYEVPENPDENFLLGIESSFISAIGFPQCSAGGGNVASTVHSQITTTTESTTTTGFMMPSPQPQSAASTAASTTSSANSTAVGTGGSFPSATIVPASGAQRTMFSASWSALMAAVAVLVWAL